jgi:hypothetical protein
VSQSPDVSRATHDRSRPEDSAAASSSIGAAGSSGRKGDRRRLHERLIALALIIAALPLTGLLAFGASSYVSFRSGLDLVYRSQGQNGLWLGHEWVGESHAENEYAELATRLRDAEITDAFFHVGPLDREGRIARHRFLHAAELVRHLRRFYPELHIQAWMGQLEKRGGGPLDLSREDVRGRISQTARGFLRRGFDGIHYDIEPIYPGDENFLDLLRTTHEMTVGEGAVLSVATVQTEPFLGFGTLSRLVAKSSHLWSADYYRKVAEHVDQVAVMMYGTGMPTDWLYGNWVRGETSKIVQLVGKDVTVFMGIPTYEERSLAFHPKAENIQSGIRGVQKGLERIDQDLVRNVGIALYADWTTDRTEWSVYHRAWLGKSA